MLNFLLSIDAHSDGNYYFSNVGEAFIYALIGFFVVFLGIVLIIFIIWIIGLILRKTNNLAFLSRFMSKCKTKRKAFFAKLKRKKSEEEKTEGESGTVAVDSGDISEEVKVAIIAAIMAYYSEEKPQCEFKVKRIRRI